MDVDLNGNFIIAGSSSSSNLASGGKYPNPFLLFLLPDGTQRWYQSLNPDHDQIDAVSFKPDGSAFVFTSQIGQRNFLVVVNPATGYNVIGSYEIEDSGAFIYYKTWGGSLLFTQNEIVVGGQGDRGGNDRFKILSFDSITMNLKWEYELFRGNIGECHAVIEGQSSDLYFGGWQQDGSLVTDRKFATVGRILKTQGSTRGRSDWIKEDDQNRVSEFYFIKKLRLTITPLKRLVGCLNFVSTTTAPFGILEIDLSGTYNPSSISNYEYKLTNEVLSCEGLYLKDSTEYYAYISFQKSQAQKFAKILSSTKAIQFQDLPVTTGTMTGSFFVSITKSYYLGSLSQVNAASGIQTFVRTAGYIMSYDLTESCILHTYTWSTSSTMTIITALTFSLSSSNENNIAGMNLGSRSMTTTIPGLNEINPVWCTELLSISLPTFSDQTYYINDPPLTFLVPKFQLSRVCSDESWIYQYHYMNPLATLTFPIFITRTDFTYSVSTNTYTNVGTYQMRIIGTLPNLQQATRLFNINIAIDCDKTIVTKGTITSPQTYQITQGSVKILGSTSGWSQNIPSPQCPTMTFSLTNQLDGQIADSIFQVNGQNIEINTNQYDKVGQYDLNLVGTIGNLISTLPFTVNVQNPCSSATISTTPVSSITYYTSQAVQTINISAFTQNSGVLACNSFTYFATYSNGFPIDSTVFNFNSATRQLQVFTSDITKVQIYTIMITGYIFDPNKKAALTFTVDVRNNCQNVILTPSSDKSVTYRQRDPATLVSGFNFLENLGTCGVFTYSLTNFDGTAFDNTIFTLNSATPSISVQTIDFSKINTYQLKLTATLGSWGSTFCKVTVNIERGCADSIITSTSISTKTYQVTDPILSFTFNDFSSSVTSCGAFTYSAFDFTSSVNNPLDTNFISFDSSTKQFNIQTANPTFIATYAIKVVGTNTTGATAFTIFTLNIVNPCASSVIQAPIVGTKTYYLLGSVTDFILPIFTQNLSHQTCSSFTYKLENSDSSQLDSSIFTFDINTRNLHIYSTDVTLIGTYTLKYSAQLLQSSVSSFTTFDVKVLHVCTTLILSKPSDITQSYGIKDTAIDLMNLQFSENLGVCGPIIYTLSNSNDTPYDVSIFTFDQVTPQIQIYTTDLSKLGTITLKLTGTMGSWASASVFITVHLTLSCNDTTITPAIIPTQVYYVTNGAKAIVFNEWTSSIPNCGTFNYSARINNKPLNSDYIDFDANMKKLTVQTSNPQFIGSYNVQIKGTLPCDAGLKYYFILEIRNPCQNAIINTPVIPNQIYYVYGSDLIFTLPIFTQNLIHLACYNFVYSLRNSNGTTIDSTLFTFNPTTRVLKVSSVNSFKIGIYNLQYKGYLLQEGVIEASTNFQIEVKHVCNIVVIQAAPDLTVTYSVQNPSLTINFLSFTDDLNICGPFSYSLSNLDDTPYDTSIFNFDSNVPTISVHTNLISQVKTYQLKLTGSLSPWGHGTTIITVKIVYGCLGTTIIPSTISDQSYYITDFAHIIKFDDWASSVSGCGTFTYSATINSSPLDSNFISLDQATRTFTIQTNNPVYIKTYTVTLTGQLPVGLSQSINFTLDIINPCRSAVVNVPIVTDKIYYVKSGTVLTLVLPQFSHDQIHSICTFDYSLKNSDGTPLDTQIFTYDSSTRQLTVSTNDIGKIGIYPLKYSAYIIEPTLSNSLTFNIQLKNICEIVLVSPPSHQIITYRQRDPILNINNLIFTENLSICGDFSYSLSNQDNTFYNSQIFSFNPSLPKISIQTNSITAVGIYQLKLTGTLGSYSSASCLITVNIERGCADTLITSDQIIDQVYYLDSPLKNIAFNDWHSSVSNCGSFKYDVTYNNGIVLDNRFINFDQLNRYILVQTSDPQFLGAYFIRVTGSLLDGANSVLTFRLDIKNPCKQAVIQTPTLSTIKYYVFGDDLNQILPQFTQNIANPLCNQMKYSLTNINDSPLDSNIFTFDKNSRNLFISTNDVSKIGTYYLKYKVQIIEPILSQSIVIQVDIYHICSIVVISPPLARTVIYAVGDSSQTITSLNFNEDQGGICGNFIYTLTNEDNTQYDTNIFVFNSLIPSIKIQTKDITKIKQYKLLLKGSLGVWGYKSTIITVDVKHGCSITQITPNLIDDQTYFVTDPILTIQFAEWQSSLTGCGVFSYSAKNQDGTNLNSDLIKFNPTSRIFTIYTNDISFKGRYLIEVNGYLIEGPSKTIIFILDVLNPCETSVITQSIPTDFIFFMPTQISFDYGIPPFTQDLSHTTCQRFSYLLTNLDNTPLDIEIFTFDPLNLNLNIATTDVSKIGTYQLKLTGYLLELYISKTVTFNVQVKNECQVVIISPPPSQTVVYYNKNPTLTINSLSFSENVGVCGPFTYTLLNSDESQYDNKVFTFFSTIQSIAISTSSLSKVGEYRLKVVGQLGVWGVAEVKIKVIIYKACNQSNINLYKIENQLYRIDTPTMNIQFLEWTSDVPGCGIFSYTVTDYKDRPLDASVIVYTASTKTFSIQTSDWTRQDEVIKVKIVGKLGSYITKDTVFWVTLVCIVDDFKLSFVMQDQIFYLNQDKMVIEAPQITQNPLCGYNIYQNIRIVDELQFRSLPDFISYDSKSYYIYSLKNPPTSEQSYKIRATYWLNDPIGKKQSFYEWKLTVIPYELKLIKQNLAPQFAEMLEVQVMKANQLRVYNFPKVIDLNNDKTTISIDCSQITNFGHCSHNQVLFQPKDIDIGTYFVYATLQDDFSPPAVNKVALQVVVEPDLKSQQTSNSINSIDSLQNSMPISKELEQGIKSTNEKGVIEIEFNKDVVMPKKEDIDSSVLNLQIYKDQNKLEKANFTWKVIQTSERKIYIKIDFNNSMSISESQYVYY